MSMSANVLAGTAAMVARWWGAFAKTWFGASARARTTQDLAGRRAPLAAVGPGLLRTGRDDRAGWGFWPHDEAIALRRGLRSVRLRAGHGGELWLSLRIGGERGHHGGTDGKREQASCKLGDRHMTTHPAASVAPHARSEVLGR